MADLPSANEINALAGLLAPGIVILWVRSRFKDITLPSISDRVMNYAIVSVAYNAATYPLFHAEGGLEIPAWLWKFLLYFLVPLLVAVVVVLFDRSEKFYAITKWLGLRPIHHEPTAWDYAYRNREPSYVLVHLSDGSTAAGVWDEGSFASSTAGDRDLLLSRLWTVEKDGAWSPVEPPRSLLICGGSIRMVEFITGGSE